MTRLDPDEIEVRCLDCNMKLCNASIYDGIPEAVGCPNPKKCREEEETSQRYRRNF